MTRPILPSSARNQKPPENNPTTTSSTLPSPGLISSNNHSQRPLSDWSWGIFTGEPEISKTAFSKKRSCPDDFLSALEAWTNDINATSEESAGRLIAKKRILDFLKDKHNASLSLHGLHLTSLPNIFSSNDFRHLSDLDLSCNGITSISSEFVSSLTCLPRLNKIDLSNNTLLRTLPPNFHLLCQQCNILLYKTGLSLEDLNALKNLKTVFLIKHNNYSFENHESTSPERLLNKLYARINASKNYPLDPSILYNGHFGPWLYYITNEFYDNPYLLKRISLFIELSHVNKNFKNSLLQTINHPLRTIKNDFPSAILSLDLSYEKYTTSLGDLENLFHTLIRGVLACKTLLPLAKKKTIKAPLIFNSHELLLEYLVKLSPLLSVNQTLLNLKNPTNDLSDEEIEEARTLLLNLFNDKEICAKFLIEDPLWQESLIERYPHEHSLHLNRTWALEQIDEKRQIRQALGKHLKKLTTKALEEPLEKKEKLSPTYFADEMRPLMHKNPLRASTLTPPPSCDPEIFTLVEIFYQKESRTMNTGPFSSFLSKAKPFKTSFYQNETLRPWLNYINTYVQDPTTLTKALHIFQLANQDLKFRNFFISQITTDKDFNSPEFKDHFFVSLLHLATQLDINNTHPTILTHLTNTLFPLEIIKEIAETKTTENKNKLILDLIHKTKLEYLNNLLNSYEFTEPSIILKEDLNRLNELYNLENFKICIKKSSKNWILPLDLLEDIKNR